MKKVSSCMVVGMLIIGGLGRAGADSVAGTIGITGIAAAGFPLGDDSVMDQTKDVGHDFGGMLRVGLTPQLSVGASYDNINLYGENGQRHRPEAFLGNVLIHLSPDAKWVPTLQAGVGIASTRKDGSFDNTAARGGLGLDYFFTPNFAVGPQVNYTFIANGSDGVDEYHILGAGLMASLFFGRTEEKAPVVVAAAPVDTDGDGVVDTADQCPNTPSGTPVDANGCPKPVTQKVSITLKVLFDTGKSVVKPEFRSEIQQVADFLNAYPGSRAEIEGHTDNQGADDVNLRLSQSRADAVRAYLIKEFSIDGARVRATGYGETQPIADNNTPEGRETNRRVVAAMEAEKVTQPK